MASRSTREDPLKAFNYLVAIPGFKRVGFEYCSGISWTSETIEYREGNATSDDPEKSAGLNSYEDITLRRGFIVPVDDQGKSFDFENWVMQVQHKDPNYRRNFSIILLNNDKTEGAVYEIINAYPKSYKPFSELQGTSNANIIEEIVITYEKYQRTGNSIAPPGPGETIAPLLGLG